MGLIVRYDRALLGLSLLAALVSSQSGRAAEDQAPQAQSSFTAATVTADGFLVGLKQEIRGVAQRSAFLRIIGGPRISHTAIRLPPEIRGREIRAILSTPGGYALVVTQNTLQSGDDPMIHLLQVVQKKWRKLGAIKCPEFSDSIFWEPGKIRMECNEGRRVLSHPSIRGKGSVVIPQTQARSPGATVELQGEAHAWDRIKLVSGSVESELKVGSVQFN